MTGIDHYTITTGHLRRSDRAEVADHVIAMLAPLLRPGDHRLPYPFGAYTCRTTIDGTTLAATVYSPAGAPLVTTVVVVDDAGLARALRATGARPTRPLRQPAALVELHETVTTDPGSVDWLGDFERCLAWAWIERKQ